MKHDSKDCCLPIVYVLSARCFSRGSATAGEESFPDWFALRQPFLSTAAQYRVVSPRIAGVRLYRGAKHLVEYRFAEGKNERYAILAAELVNLGVDVIVTGGTAATLAAKQATSTIPIVVLNAGDLVGEGLVASLARPGGNVTGFTSVDPDFSAKRLQLLRETFPTVSRVAVLYHGGPGGDQEELGETQTAAKSLAVQIQPLQVLEPDQFQRAYTAMTKERAQALIIFPGTFTGFHRNALLELAAKIRIPMMCARPEWSEAGCLISYGHDPRDQFRRAVIYVDKILKEQSLQTSPCSSRQSSSW